MGETVTALTIGARVSTAGGPGRIAAWRRSERFVFGRPDLVVYAVVELDTGSRRLYPVSQITLEEKETHR